MCPSSSILQKDEMFKRVTKLAEKANLKPRKDEDEESEEEIDDETLLQGLQAYMDGTLGSSDEESENEEGGREVFSCTLCPRKKFYSEEKVEEHVNTRGHVEREITHLKKQTAVLQSEQERLSRKQTQLAGVEKRRENKRKSEDAESTTKKSKPQSKQVDSNDTKHAKRTA